jgi:hypothetical protein
MIFIFKFNKDNPRVITTNQFTETYFNPTIELTKVNKKNNRQNVAGSLKINIPTIIEPTAPMPVQTA